MATITESFNRADAAGLGPDLTWSGPDAQWATASNQGVINAVTAAEIAKRAESDTSSVDMYAEVTIPDFGNASYCDIGICVRMNSTRDTFYCLKRGARTGMLTGFYELRKYVAGVLTVLTGPTALAFSFPEVNTIEVEGGTIRFLRNGTLVTSVVDTDIASGSFAGLNGFRSSSLSSRRIIFDSFEAGSLAAGSNQNADAGPMATALALSAAGAAQLVGASVDLATTLSLAAAGAVQATTTVEALAASLTLGADGVAGIWVTAQALPFTVDLQGSGVAQATAAADPFALSLTLAALAEGDATVTAEPLTLALDFDWCEAETAATITGDEMRTPGNEIVAIAWLKTVPGLPTNQISKRLPHDNSTWAASGFVQVTAVGGSPDVDVPMRRPIIQIDCWAIAPDSKKPPWGKANNLAELIRDACYDDREHAILVTLPDFRQARMMSVYMLGEPVVAREPDLMYAHYTFDLQMHWTYVQEATP